MAVADFTAAQNYDLSIPVTPVKAPSPTATSLGVIGVMISIGCMRGLGTRAAGAGT